MNGYLVDTNIPSELTRDTPDARVVSFLHNTPQDKLFLSVMTIGEISKGIATLPTGKKRHTLQTWLDQDLRLWFGGRILPVSEAIADRWGKLSAAARASGTPLPVVDGLLAATALEHDLILVTRNVKDFSVLGQDLLNPFAS